MRKGFVIVAAAAMLLLLACPSGGPTVSITAPHNGDTVNHGIIAIKAYATDKTGVTKVEFYVDGALEATDDAGVSDTFSGSWDASSATNGAHALKAKAYNAGGKTGENSISVTLAGGQSIHTSDITGDSIWYPAGNPHIIDANISVKDNGVLTIMPGCLVKFNPGNELRCGAYASPGAIKAIGKADSTILFTSNVGTPSPGDWEDIGLNEGTMSTTQFAYCTFEYGGSDNGLGDIYLSGTSVKIDHCHIRKSLNYGIYCASDAYFSSFTYNTVDSCTKYPIHIDADQVGSLGANSTFRGNAAGRDMIEVVSGTVTASQTWANQGVPYLITGNVWISDASNNPVLTLAAGDTLKVEPGFEILVGHYSAPGALSAVGTAGSPIVFTTNVSSPQPGDHWSDIGIYEGSTSSTQLEYCIIEYAGNSSGSGAVYVDNSAPKIDNCTIRHSSDYGIFSSSSGVRFASFQNNTITDCAKYPIHILPDDIRRLGTGNTLTGNASGYDAIEVVSGTVAATATWLNQGVPYILDGSVWVNDASSPMLTIAPGNTLKFRSYAELLIGHYSSPGGLIADGTSGRITFTSAVTPPAPGNWLCVSFYGGTLSGSELVNCDVMYGGHDDYGDIYIDQSTPTITGNNISNSLGWGIYLESAPYPDPFQLESNNTFSNCLLGNVRIPPVQ